MQQPVCPQCGAEIPAQNINTQNTVAYCASCHYAFDYTENHAAANTKTLIPFNKTENLKIYDRSDCSVEIVCSWFKGLPALNFTTTAAMLDLTWVYLIRDYNFAELLNDGNIENLLFQTSMILLAPLVTYFAFAIYTNDTRIRIDGTKLIVKTGPIPVHFPHRLNLSDIENFIIRATRLRQIGMTNQVVLIANTRTHDKRAITTNSEINIHFIQQEITQMHNIPAHNLIPNPYRQVV